MPPPDPPPTHGHGHGHGHGVGLVAPLGPVARRSLTAAIVVAALATVAGLVVLWPAGDEPVIDDPGFIAVFHDGVVTEVGLCSGLDASAACRTASVRMVAGPDVGEVVTSDAFFRDLQVGDRVVMGYDDRLPEDLRYQLTDRARKPTLTWLAVAFAVAVVALGRWRGIAALGGLAVSLVTLVAFTVPAIVDGASPVAVAAVSAAVIAFAALYLTHGVGPMTTVALLGTLGALLITVAVGALAVSAARFSGLGDEDARFLDAIGSLDLPGLVLAGLVIGALGAIDDVTVTQASVVFELRSADPNAGVADLARAGLRVGRDHIASTVNTLALAYAGASLPLVILLVETRQSLGTVVNSETVATEVVATLVGGLGLVAAVPLTTWLAALVAAGVDPERAETFDDLRALADDDHAAGAG